jgi:hypothetical protein
MGETKMQKVTALMTLFLIIIVSTIPLGCFVSEITGSGNLETRSKDFSGFTKIEANNGFEVIVTKSSTFSVEIIADDNVHKYLDISKSGDTLKIQTESGHTWHSVTLRANITMPDINEIDLSSGALVDVTGFSFIHDFKVNLSSGSHVTGEIDVGNADFNLSSGSHITLTGSADDLEADGSSGSHFNLEDFALNHADIALSSGSHATINVGGTLDVNLSSGSHVTYSGNPALGDIDVSADSTLSSQ